MHKDILAHMSPDQFISLHLKDMGIVANLSQGWSLHSKMAHT